MPLTTVAEAQDVPGGDGEAAVEGKLSEQGFEEVKDAYSKEDERAHTAAED